jgi:hypothetical protein
MRLGSGSEPVADPEQKCGLDLGRNPLRIQSRNAAWVWVGARCGPRAEMRLGSGSGPPRRCTRPRGAAGLPAQRPVLNSDLGAPAAALRSELQPAFGLRTSACRSPEARTRDEGDLKARPPRTHTHRPVGIISYQVNALRLLRQSRC